MSQKDQISIFHSYVFILLMKKIFHLEGTVCAIWCILIEFKGISESQLF